MVDIKEQSPLSLAYLGDAVYSLYIREHLVKSKRYNINVLNNYTVKYVSAKGQYLALELISDILTDEEKRIEKRGRNSSKISVAKHASVEEYRASTGFECLLGYLKLTNQDERIEYLVNYIIDNIEL